MGRCELRRRWRCGYSTATNLHKWMPVNGSDQLQQWTKWRHVHGLHGLYKRRLPGYVHSRTKTKNAHFVRGWRTTPFHSIIERIRYSGHRRVATVGQRSTVAAYKDISQSGDNRTYYKLGI